MLYLAWEVMAEFVGTAYLVASIIGSGTMGGNLSPDNGVAFARQHYCDHGDFVCSYQCS